MYFAIEPPHASLPLQISHALAELRRAIVDAPLHVFALVDDAFDEALLGARKWSRRPKYSLYDGTALHGLEAAAPHLLTAPAAPDEQSAWLHEIFAACAGRPMLSIVACTLPAAALQDHLRPYLIARTPDSLEWPVRWGDTRVLPGLIDTLEPGRREHLLSPFHHWWSTARDGTLIGWQGGACAAPKPADCDKLPIRDATFARLVELAEADAVLANIHDTQPDLLRQHRPFDCHDRVARHLVIASTCGISAAGARQHFSVLALCLADDFTEHPAMAALLQRVRQGADYRTEIGTLQTGFWQEAAA
ncbi:DUF4123 domain-containing protein [Aromatoleum diolicum]|uniref:DUF4123 domain-containing protein n=1 Tax=Aromatoleum diolicum TaxID=75796 RepID=A0ABX1QD66_9RHOO|nr:DUF4123 domain-containing protein [Aromatoleum diolicum]NMG75455.1 DUF4123 domain-containing protein [Aromatoleum diolicum]